MKRYSLYHLNIHPTATVDEDAELGPGTKVWHYTHIMAGAKLGAKCNIGQGVFIARGVVLGEGCRVQNHVSLFEGVTCGDFVFIGPSAVFTNVRNPRSEIPRREQYLPTRIGHGVTIGANATIICGVTLGDYCFVGAGAVVNRDVAPFSLVVGTPARHTGWMSHAGHRLHFDASGHANDPETGEQYVLREGAVSPVSSTN